MITVRVKNTWQYPYFYNYTGSVWKIQYLCIRLMIFQTRSGVSGSFYVANVSDFLYNIREDYGEKGVLILE